jgi:hypothetical protein
MGMISQKNNRKQTVFPASSQVIIHEYPNFVEWIAGFSLKISESDLGKWTAAALVATAIAIYYPTYGDDYDLWFHLAYGKHYVTNFTWHIDHSVYSWTPTDTSNWIYGTWLGSSVMYIFYQYIGGYAGLSVMQWMILLSVFWGMIFYARLTSSNRTDVFCFMGVLLVALILKLTQVYIKPQMISTWLFNLTVFIYFLYKRAGHKKIFYLYSYPLIFLIWVNVHGEFFVGLIFIAVAFGGDVLSYLFLKKQGDSYSSIEIVKTGCCVVLSFAVILVNPDGINYPLSILKGLITKPEVANSVNVSMGSMWQHIGLSNFNFNFVNAANSIVFMAGLYLLFFVISISKKRKTDWSLFLLNIVFFIISMTAARATVFYPIVWFYSFYTIVAQSDLLEIKRKFLPFALVIILCLVPYCIYGVAIYMPYATWFGYDIDDYVPKKEAEFIVQSHLPGPIFNDYLTGAYMMWAMYPEYKNWIDPRWAPFTKQVLPDWVSLPQHLTSEYLTQFTKIYPFKVAMIGMWCSNITFWLLSSPDWRLLYFDKKAAVVVHKSIIPQIPEESLKADVGTSRFSEIENPVVLFNLFQFYVAIGPSYAMDIRRFYEYNVSNWYQSKKEQLAIMDSMIVNKENEIRQKAQNAPNQS